MNLRRGLNSLLTKTQLSLRRSSGDQLGSVSADPSSPTCSALIGQSQWVLIIRWRRPGQTSNIAMWLGEIKHQIRSLRCSSFPYHLGSDKLNREKHNERIKSEELIVHKTPIVRTFLNNFIQTKTILITFVVRVCLIAFLNVFHC